jgi:threonylcarbamoyladenosine tRNA methylthiotransferase MtaB
MNTRASVEAVSFGCRLNLVESETMRREAIAQGRSNLTIVNTCAVTAEAVRQAGQTIRRLKREDPRREIIVTGCAAQTDPQRFAKMPEVAHVLGNADKVLPATWMPAHDAHPAVTDIMERRADTLPLVEGVEDHTRAFLGIQTGCDHRCTFCIIPFGRGPSRSVAQEDVIAAAARLAAQGFREIVLTGVDLTSYGQDLDGKPSLGQLVKAILRSVPNLPRLRLSSIDCIEVDEDLRDAIAHEARLMPHLHLSLQAGHDITLKRMNRRHLRADAIKLCADLRRLRPDIVFGADLIAGFAGETEAMFQATLDLIEECGLAYLHVFPFSARPGTPAAKMPSLPGAVIKERAKRLRDAGDAALAAHLARHVGQRVSILTERGGTGRAEDFSLVQVGDIAPGLLIDREIIASDGKKLIAVSEQPLSQRRNRI